MTFDGKDVPIESGYVSEREIPKGVTGPMSTAFDTPGGFHRAMTLRLTLSADFTFGRQPKPFELNTAGGEVLSGVVGALMPLLVRAGEDVSFAFPEQPTWA